MKPSTLDALIQAGGPEQFVREASEQAIKAERQYWLTALEKKLLPRGRKKTALHAQYVRDLRRRLGLGQAQAVVREQTRGRVQRLRALGDWGERKAVELLKRAGFTDIQELNSEFRNHPFGDVCATRGGVRYLIGVKTRNKYQTSGLLNPTYNVRKRGAEVGAIARRHRAVSAWMAISVIPETQTFSTYFGTLAQIEESGERFSIPMLPKHVANYECLSQPAEEFDSSIRVDWSNGGYSRRKP
jgi:hypothetical protein